jgi:hypothetical protein
MNTYGTEGCNPADNSMMELRFTEDSEIFYGAFQTGAPVFFSSKLHGLLLIFTIVSGGRFVTCKATTVLQNNIK